MPMLPTDNERAAERFARSLAPGGARHFYDANRRTGIIFAYDYFHALMQEAAAALPAGSKLRAQLTERAQGSPADTPVWDAVLMFRPGTRWEERSPEPDWWARQVEFFGPGRSDGITGVIWNSDRPLPQETDWFAELREAVRTMTNQR